MDLALAALALTALLLGLALGYLAGNRGLARMRSERDQTLDKFRGAITDLAAAEERGKAVPRLETALEITVREREEARTEAARLKATQAERELAFEARLAQLQEAREQLSQQFSEIGGKLLGEAQEAFLKRADQRFNQAGEHNEAKLKLLLSPVQDTLKRYELSLVEIEKARVGTYSELKEAVSQLTQGNDHVRRETARLANVMRSSPKARGRWGEEQLRTILESAGLAENVDFFLQASVNDGERQLRPDCVINLPGGRVIVIDVKCPLVHFEQAFDEEDETQRSLLLAEHASAMKAYANQLGRKGYWRQFDRSPDFVIMFIPGEHFLAAAAERAPDLIETAFRNDVIIASTINMLALAKVMAGMWRQEHLAEQAKEVADVGRELYKRLATMGSHVSRLGRNLVLVNSAYNDFVGSLEGQVMTQAKRFESLKVETGGKTIEPLPIVETAVRPLVKLMPIDMESDAAG